MSNYIYKTAINKLANKSLGTLATRMNETVKVFNIEAINNDVVYKAFTQTITIFQKTLNSDDVILDLSEEAAVKYLTRRDTFLALYVYSEGICNTAEPETAQLAREVYKIISLYGRGFIHKRLGAQTACYAHIISLITLPEVAAKMATLGLDKLATNFKNAHSDYESAYLASKISSNQKVYPSSLRRKMIADAKGFIDHILQLAKVSGDAKLTELADNLVKRVQELDTMRKSSKNEAPKDASSENDIKKEDTDSEMKAS